LWGGEKQHVHDLEVKAKGKTRTVRKRSSFKKSEGKSYYTSFGLGSCYFGSFPSGHKLHMHLLVCAIRKEHTSFSPIAGEGRWGGGLLESHRRNSG